MSWHIKETDIYVSLQYGVAWFHLRDCGPWQRRNQILVDTDMNTHW